MLRDTTLVMLSGGLDSTTVLYKLLKETKDPIHAHFVYYINVENRFTCEHAAVISIVDWCYKIRPFVFTRSTMDFSFTGTNIPWDYQVLCFMAAQVAVTYQNISKVAFGLEANEIDRTLWGMNWTHGRNIYDTVHRVAEHRADWIFPIKEMTRKDEFEYLPRELYNLTWSCRQPVRGQHTFQPCLQCSPCWEANKQGFPLPNDKSLVNAI